VQPRENMLYTAVVDTGCRVNGRDGAVTASMAGSSMRLVRDHDLWQTVTGPDHGPSPASWMIRPCDRLSSFISNVTKYVATARSGT